MNYVLFCLLILLGMSACKTEKNQYLVEDDQVGVINLKGRTLDDPIFFMMNYYKKKEPESLGLMLLRMQNSGIINNPKDPQTECFLVTVVAFLSEAMKQHPDQEFGFDKFMKNYESVALRTLGNACWMANTPNSRILLKDLSTRIIELESLIGLKTKEVLKADENITQMYQLYYCFGIVFASGKIDALEKILYCLDSVKYLNNRDVSQKLIFQTAKKMIISSCYSDRIINDYCEKRAQVDDIVGKEVKKIINQIKMQQEMINEQKGNNLSDSSLSSTPKKTIINQPIQPAQRKTTSDISTPVEKTVTAPSLPLAPKRVKKLDDE